MYKCVIPVCMEFAFNFAHEIWKGSQGANQTMVASGSERLCGQSPCPLLGCRHTRCPALRDRGKEKQEADRKAF